VALPVRRTAPHCLTGAGFQRGASTKRPSRGGSVQSQMVKVVVTLTLIVLGASACSAGGSAAPTTTNHAAEPGPCVETPRRVASSFTPFGSVYALGGGPVYPLFDTLPYVPGGEGAVGRVRYGSAHLGRWHYVKTLWITAPSYHGAITVTGRALSGSGRLAFTIGHGRTATLHIPQHAGQGWGDYSTGTLLSQPGCFVFNVSLGTARSYRIEFDAGRTLNGSRSAPPNAVRPRDLTS
jgi:hypothetical protein